MYQHSSLAQHLVFLVNLCCLRFLPPDLHKTMKITVYIIIDFSSGHAFFLKKNIFDFFYLSSFLNLLIFLLIFKIVFSDINEGIISFESSTVILLHS